MNLLPPSLAACFIAVLAALCFRMWMAFNRNDSELLTKLNTLKDEIDANSATVNRNTDVIAARLDIMEAKVTTLGLARGFPK